MSNGCQTLGDIPYFFSTGQTHVHVEGRIYLLLLQAVLQDLMRKVFLCMSDMENATENCLVHEISLLISCCSCIRRQSHNPAFPQTAINHTTFEASNDTYCDPLASSKWLHLMRIKHEKQLTFLQGNIQQDEVIQMVFCSSRCGKNYLETIDPIEKLNLVKVIISIAANLSWHLHQVNVNNAFLYEEINNMLPHRKGKEKVCMLKMLFMG